MLTAPRLFDRSHRAVRIFMTGTGTVPEFANGMINPRAVHLLVLALLIVTRVATCAIRLIGAVEPGHRLAVTLVTIYAPNSGIMVARVVARRRTVGEDWCPVGSAVAFVALNRCYKVIGGLARCRAAVVA